MGSKNYNQRTTIKDSLRCIQANSLTEKSTQGGLVPSPISEEMNMGLPKVILGW
jgi:hypothetical protein